MHLLFLTDRLSFFGGADVHLRQVVQWAMCDGWQVHIACGRVEAGAGIEGASVEVVGALGSPAADPRLGALPSLLEAADIVHAQNVMNPVALTAAAETGRAVVTVQDHRVFCPGPGRTLPSGERCRDTMASSVCASCLPDRGYRRRMLTLTRSRLQALASTRLVVLSSYMAEELRALGLGATVIPPWVDAGPPRHREGDAVVLGGRLVRHKAPRLAWNAWRRAGRPVPLRVVGAGAAAEALEDAVHLGWIDHASVLRELRRGVALLFPARWQEPFGILGVEALSQGTPVIVTDVAGTRDWSDEGCLRVPAGDEDGFTDAVRLVCGSPSAALALGEAGRLMVTRRFDRRAITARLRAVYRAAGGPATGTA